MASRIATAAYALIAYVAFVAALVWAIGFLANAFFAKSVDAGPSSPRPLAIAIDLGVLGLFAVQHTVMARGAFKRHLTRLVPPAAERSTFVLAASAVLLATFWAWRPIGATVWDVEAPLARYLVLAAYGAGWTVVVWSTFIIDHFEFFGLRQAYTALRHRSVRTAPFKDVWLYALVRHPMMLGLVIAFWSAPRMTAGHLLFAAAATAYIVVGIRFEERELRRQLGESYGDYADRVPMLVPRLPGRAAAPPLTPRDAALLVGAKSTCHESELPLIDGLRATETIEHTSVCQEAWQWSRR